MENFERDPNKTYVVHAKNYNHDVYIGRPSKWGNPYSHKEGTLAKYKVLTRQEAISGYVNHLIETGLMNEIKELKGKILGCWCCKTPSDGLEKSFVCHGQVIARILNTPPQAKLFN